jgi:hypothetical protein
VWELQAEAWGSFFFLGWAKAMNTPIPGIIELATKLNPDSPIIQDPPKTLVCLDPGETTGMAVFRGPDFRLLLCGQLDTAELGRGVEALQELLRSVLGAQTSGVEAGAETGSPRTYVVIEDYKVYGWKTEQHTWAELHTPKLIGAFVTLCIMYNLPYSMQMAVQAKQFCTDDKLKAWGLYKPGLRHARDAIRHGIYFTLFDRSYKVQAKK